ncbi:short-chain dehydrogenase [Chryseobacterium formosense]|uniref:Short-chain dehydrogenase n=1 Tax=Chryseobacterium formosense TaxID=236814 RepID=A0A085ZAE3_9FLAO|nr:SDR family NAD(P)-dependent oxidoreductase [Chryseobacterium formosense]KFF01407.1 short-chain dehydrogenase [Chryseobacterium formosense]SFT46895.1 NAD(P)-dependent dehydrogenase, short-chain alcohol dehydrogenase family [Chryseobacterium formosense]
MKKVFITGANKGIGFATARQLLQKGFYVYLGCRSEERGIEALERLKSEGLIHCEVVFIDITDDVSVKNARIWLGKKTERLDVLINNVGITGGIPQDALNATISEFKKVLNTNLFGTLSVVQAFTNLLEKSEQPHIINISSSIGSLTLHGDRNWKYYDNANLFMVYAVSKAALNMYSISLGNQLPKFRVHLIDPGFIKTDLTNNQGTGTPDEAANTIVHTVLNKNIPTKKFISEDHDPEKHECPW